MPKCQLRIAVKLTSDYMPWQEVPVSGLRLANSQPSRPGEFHPYSIVQVDPVQARTTI